MREPGTTRNDTSYPDRRARLDAAIGLAMLPVGVTLGLVAALASIILLVGAVLALCWASWWLTLWCFAAGTACAWIAVTAIEIVSAFDWRPLPRVAAVAGVAIVACPYWW